MKRTLSTFLTMVIALNILGVGIVSAFNSPAIEQKVRNEYEEMYNISYNKGCNLTWINGYKNTSLKVCSSEELDSHFSERDEIISKYDEFSFKDKFLVFLFWANGSPGADFRVTSVSDNDNLIDIEITGDFSKMSAAAVVEYGYIVLEMPHELADKDIKVTKANQPTTYTIVAVVTAGGTVSGGGVYAKDTTATLTATTNSGYMFDGWYESGSRISIDTEYSFTVEKARTLEARFIKPALSITPSSHTFPTVSEGYKTQDEKLFTVQRLDIMTVVIPSRALISAGADNFEISTPLPGAIPGTNPVTVGVRPKTGLPPGTYTGTLTVEAGLLTLGTITADFSFAVTKPQSAPQNPGGSNGFSPSGGGSTNPTPSGGGSKETNASTEDTATGSSKTFETEVATITLDANVLEAAAKEGGGDVTVSAALAEEQHNGRPVYELKIMSGDTQISGFLGGKATVEIPYALKSGENPNAIVVYYLDANGRLNLERGYYEDGKIIFTITHFSKFVIGYNPIVYPDIPSDAWYKNAVDFITAREITVGIEGDVYEPLKVLTRGEFAANLMKAYGIEVDPESTSNFADVDASAAYADYLATGLKLGIVSGVGNGNFAPERQITREEMFTMLYNILVEIDEAPAKTSNGNALSGFSDADSVSDWSRNAIGALLEAGTIAGVGDNRLNPSGKSDRAQMASMIFNLLTK